NETSNKTNNRRGMIRIQKDKCVVDQRGPLSCLHTSPCARLAYTNGAFYLCASATATEGPAAPRLPARQIDEHGDKPPAPRFMVSTGASGSCKKKLRRRRPTKRLAF